jgi:hypothetical protein
MQVWEETGGNLREVARAILLSEEFLSLKFQKAKIKTPFEQLAGTARILNAELTDAQLKQATADMDLAGMELFDFADPTGESELGIDWMHTIGMLERLKWIGRGINPETPAERRFAWPASSFVARYQLKTAAEIAGFFIQLIHPEGILENDRALALDAYQRAAANKVEAMVSFLLSIAPAMQQ